MKYILGLESDFQLILSVFYIIGNLSGVAVWTKITKKTKNKKAVYLLGSLLMVISLIPGIWISDVFSLVLVVFFVAFFAGALMINLLPLISDVLDKAAIRTGKRQAGVYMGIRAFFARFSLIVATSSIAIIHMVTGFIPDAPVGTDTQTPLGLFGIRIHFVIIPMISIALGALILYKFFDIQGEKREKLKAKIKEFNL